MKAAAHLPARRYSNKHRAGQTMVFMIVALLLIVFMVCWQFDVHKVISVKWRSQNAGDAAALAAARWQGMTLNIIGDLNIMKAAALSMDDADAVADIDAIQARLVFAGPMIALQAAQQAGKQNGVYVHGRFSERLLKHATDVREHYPQVFEELYPGCWDDYAGMLNAICVEGIAVAPDNMKIYDDVIGGHTLLDRAFYQAVAGQEWCWFKHNNLALLTDYHDFHYWPELPVVELTDVDNCEVFGLGLSRVHTRLLDIRGTGVTEILNSLIDSGSRPHLEVGVISSEVASVHSDWFVYNQEWRSWNALQPEGEDPFPVLGPPLPEYDYAGADAATRVYAQATRLAPGEASHTITWTGAAKPFGYLEDDEGGRVRPNSAGLVLPAFREVRLIPVDASSSPANGSFDLDWRDHVEIHLPAYMADGIGALEPGCWFCRALRIWEDPGFRRRGYDWLTMTDKNGKLVHPCDHAPPSGRGSPGGGRRRAH